MHNPKNKIELRNISKIVIFENNSNKFIYSHYKLFYSFIFI